MVGFETVLLQTIWLLFHHRWLAENVLPKYVILKKAFNEQGSNSVFKKILALNGRILVE